MNKHKLKYNEIKEFREDLHREQKGICPICGDNVALDYAVLDHDHVSGHIRAVLHRDCNILLGKVENYTRFKGKRMQTEARLEVALSGLWAFMQADYTDNPLHHTFLLPEDKLQRKYKRLFKRSKRPETKAKYRKLIEDLK